MRIKVIGENDCARALRSVLRKGGFSVTEYLPGDAVLVSGYVITVEETSGERIEFDSVDCELEDNILRQVSRLSKQPIVVDRPGGTVHSDRELRILVPRSPAQQLAVEFGVLRGLVDTVGMNPAEAPQPPKPAWYKRWFALLALVLLLSAGGFGQAPAGQPDKVPFATQAKNALAPPLGAEDRVAIRDLQYQQDRLVIELKNLDLQRTELNKKIAEIRSQINEQAYSTATRLKVDVKKYALDLDTLSWVRRAEQEKTNEKQ